MLLKSIYKVTFDFILLNFLIRKIITKLNKTKNTDNGDNKL